MMIDAAGLQPGQRVLEPSAGEGAIALGIMAEAGAAPDCIEVNAARASLVALMPSGVTFRQDTAHQEFRNMIMGAGGTITPLPSGSFKVSGTGVETVLVTIDA
jgi:hypothetical protein